MSRKAATAIATLYERRGYPSCDFPAMRFRPELVMSQDGFSLKPKDYPITSRYDIKTRIKAKTLRDRESFSLLTRLPFDTGFDTVFYDIMKSQNSFYQTRMLNNSCSRKAVFL